MKMLSNLEIHAFSNKLAQAIIDSGNNKKNWDEPHKTKWAVHGIMRPISDAAIILTMVKV